MESACLVPDVFVREDGSFVSAWIGGATVDDWKVWSRRFSAAGEPLGAALQVSEPPPGGYSGRPSVAGDALGRFVVAWSDVDPAHPEENDIFARRFGADGSALGPVFRVNTLTAGQQIAQRVAVAATGEFVITWDGPRADGRSLEAFARLFAADGTPRGPEFQVNQTEVWAQFESAVDMDSAGNFLVAWQSESSPLGGSEEVLARLYRADGRPMSDEFQVNPPSSRLEEYPDVALDDSGAFAVVYDTYFFELGATELYSRRYLAGCPPDATFLSLHGGRFDLCARWETTTGLTGAAVPHPLTEDSGAFWFFSPQNLELFVKVLDGCAVNQIYWVYAAGLTDVGVDLTILDTWSGQVFSVSRPRGTPFQPVQDVAALPVCGIPPPH